MTRSYLERDLKLLWGLAAARCSFPDCRTELVADKTASDAEAVLGQIAHIVAASDKGPRADADYPADLRDRYENLILLCGHHHPQIDKQPNTYTVEDLREWKRNHEAWVRDRLREEMPGVSFAELEVLTQGLLNAPGEASATWQPLDPSEKMKRNQLTDRIRFELTMGLSKTREVARFLAHVALMDAEFPERLKAGFVTEYRHQLEDGVDGDALFEGLRLFAARGQRGFRFQAAGLAILAYLFEACEVFER